MSITQRLVRLVGFDQLAHRPPLSPRFWAYCVAAYLIPVVVQVGFPEDPGLTDELAWLLTLVPAVLLSLHFGLRGAVAGLVMGTALFLTVEWVVAINYTPDDWRITTPIYIAYGTLSITVGWLSEELHSYYHQALSKQRLASIGEFAVTIRHEVNNALTTVVSESQLLLSEEGLTTSQRASAQNLYEAAMRIAADIKKMTSLADAPVTTYAGGVKMVDLHAAQTHSTA